MVENKDSYSSTLHHSKEKILGEASLLKLFLLVLVSLVLCAVGPLAIFSPIPLALAFLIYGFVRTFALSTLAVFATMFLSVATGTADFFNYSIMMIIVTIVGFMVSTIVVRGEHPVRGFIIRGILSLVVIASFSFIADKVSQGGLVGVFEKQVIAATVLMKSSPDYKPYLEAGGDEARQIEQFINNPLEIVRPFYSWVYSLIFILVFFALWLSTFTMMRNKKIWHSYHSNYNYSLKDFVQFKVPDLFIYLVILGFALFVGADYVETKSLEVIGGNILLALGVLYFFQGMGVYVDLLRYLRIFGLLRNLLTIMTIFYGYQFVAIAGLFDTWVNFRKYFVKKLN